MHFPVLISSYQAVPLLAARNAGKRTVSTSVDLGLNGTEAELGEEGIRVAASGVEFPWSLVDSAAADPRRVWTLSSSGPAPVQLFSPTTGWMRVLCPTPTAPTVLVSGIPMHRVKHTDPIQDTQFKMRALGTTRGHVLDTATGLGYTAIAAARDAIEVVTIELDPTAIELANLNPWSAALFERSNVVQIVGDAFEELDRFPAGHFSAVLHDPPTLSLAGDLYSEEFYFKLKRVLSRRGRLFHYIGDPESGLGKRVYPGVMRRLAAAGFTNVRREHEAHGVSASA